jgi:hypothetical protein
MQMKNIPQKIYLQIGQGNEDEPDFSAFSEVTWSADKVFSNDIEFVLQQTPCSTLRELLEQKLSNAYAARDFATMAQNEAKHMKASERIKTLEEVLKLISDMSPVA